MQGEELKNIKSTEIIIIHMDDGDYIVGPRVEYIDLFRNRRKTILRKISSRVTTMIPMKQNVSKEDDLISYISSDSAVAITRYDGYKGYILPGVYPQKKGEKAVLLTYKMLTTEKPISLTKQFEGKSVIKKAPSKPKKPKIEKESILPVKMSTYDDITLFHVLQV